MLVVSTSNAIYCVNEAGTVEPVLTRKHTPGLFARRGRGFFGICACNGGAEILIASRERLGTRPNGKPTTDVKLFRLRLAGRQIIPEGAVRDVHDVHQIEFDGQYVFLTDTGKNRIVVHDLAHQRTIGRINIGPDRRDVNHVNALSIRDGRLFVGLNNRGDEPSAIAAFPLDDLAPGDHDLDPDQVYRRLHGWQHTHDLAWSGERLLACASMEGVVFCTETLEAIVEAPGWVRGVAPAEEGLWVGSSPVAPRSRRHDRRLDGALHLFGPRGHHLQTIALPGAGQVNDVLYVPGGA